MSDSRLIGQLGYTVKGEIIGQLNYSSVPTNRGAINTYDSFTEFPTFGDPRLLYIDASTDKVYRFQESDCTYYCVGSNYEDIKTIEGGNA